MTLNRGWLSRFAAAALLLGCAGTAGAHYLWAALTEADGKATGNVYFEESPAPGDGHYLDPFVKGGKTWVRTASDPKPTPLGLKEMTAPDRRWLAAPVDVEPPRALESTGTFGTYTYGKTEVLLHYYAKFLDVSEHEDLHELARAGHLKLDIVPHDEGEKLELTLLWQGKPAPDCRFYVRGPKKFRLNTRTDGKGRVVIETKDAGRYLFRAYVELDEAGEYEGKPYELIRHHATLTMDLPLAK